MLGDPTAVQHTGEFFAVFFKDSKNSSAALRRIVQTGLPRQTFAWYLWTCFQASVLHSDGFDAKSV